MDDSAQSAKPADEPKSELNLPEGALVILPLRNAVLFPGIVTPLTLGRPQSIAGAQAAAQADKPIGVLLQNDPTVENPGPEHLHQVGTAAEILRYVTAPDGGHHLIARGQRRFRVLEFLPGYPYLVARVDEVGDAEVYSTEIAARMHQLRERAREAISLLPNVPTEIAGAIEQIQSPSQLADFIANVSDLTPQEKQDLLETFEVSERLDKLLRYLAKQIEVLRLSKQIGEQTQESLAGRQREHILREQLRQIQKELGEGEEGQAEIAELREAVTKAGMSEEAEKQALKELKRLERMSEASAEHGMVRTYLDWLIELPWSKLSDERIDIAEARRILDEDHYGLPKVKQRILEYLAVRKLKPDGKSPILCFVGPPGVGKTSLGQSIARATGRKFGRISLGGVHDEAEIRGHRRTYIGALPGNIIQALRKADTRNPVFMPDEMEKPGA
ncbi:MAG: LON peptidase substrate-binding domain-containing protein, partial [Methyloceanibacter sp.]|nr:LON peptidase substrate-binding domain-containing protein [Methyloceanibacter sp.]